EILTLGNTEEVPVRKKGEIVFERCIPFGITMDERICHGSYFAIAFKRFAEYLNDPSKLEGPPQVVNRDVD
ncbi:MAG: 2-oxo acid dehydrogenase subunit E2, partial [Clostridia bacterium]|nr:2-oxo acid dehydrogenase subunit E2 [Clostridia bacterium]